MRRVTLTQYLIEQQRQYGTVSPELRLLIEVIARACKMISHAVSKGPLAGIGDSMGLDNVQGEAQKKLDVIANSVLVEANEWGGQLAAMVSEEMAEPYQIPNRYPKGEFLGVFRNLDPLIGQHEGAQLAVEREADDAIAHCQHEYRRRTVHGEPGGDLFSSGLKESLMVRLRAIRRTPQDREDRTDGDVHVEVG